jgi:hypothetical protein
MNKQARVAGESRALVGSLQTLDWSVHGIPKYQEILSAIPVLAHLGHCTKASQGYPITNVFASILFIHSVQLHRFPMLVYMKHRCLAAVSVLHLQFMSSLEENRGRLLQFHLLSLFF